MLKFNYVDQLSAKSSDIFALYRFFLISTLRFCHLYREIRKNHPSRFDVNDHRFKEVLGIDMFDDFVPEDSKDAYLDYKIKQLGKAIEKRYEELECESIEVPFPLNANLDALGKMYALTEAEKFLVLFTIIVNAFNDNFYELFCLVRDNHTTARWLKDFAKLFATMTDIPIVSFEEALDSKGILFIGDILRFDTDRYSAFPHLDTANSDLDMHFFSEPAVFERYLKKQCQKAQRPKLTLKDFEHLEPTLRQLCGYLRRACLAKRRGVNVLFYGAAGTGKTQLSRVIGEAIACDIFEVAVENSSGEQVDDRRSRLVRLQRALENNQNALLVFDEAEDIFKNFSSIPFFKSVQRSELSKGWMNKMLEENATPVVWLTNSIERMDPAYIRRFDFAIEVPIPPRVQRKKIIQAATKGIVSESFCDILSHFDVIAPAVVTRAMSVTEDIMASTSSTDAESILLAQINGTLKAQGHKTVRLSALDLTDRLYDPSLSTANVDMTSLVEGIARTSEARICLYGVPGTGKTAWVRYLAKSLNKPLLVKKCSDLLGCYVGESEKNIARAFEQARSENAVLLIDEVDSLLQKRSGAHHSWEVTQVNEMLTQMERFDGVFIATTNLLDGMDEACLRRFDLKVKFDYLTTEKTIALFKSYCAEIFGSEDVEDSVLASVSELKYMAPGDFATVLRQSKFAPLENPKAFVQALAGESRLKGVGQTRRIGF